GAQLAFNISVPVAQPAYYYDPYYPAAYQTYFGYYYPTYNWYPATYYSYFYGPAAIPATTTTALHYGYPYGFGYPYAYGYPWAYGYYGAWPAAYSWNYYGYPFAYNVATGTTLASMYGY